MYNLHPPFSAFPVTLITIVFILEALNLIRRREIFGAAALVNLAAAAIAVAAAFFSGYQASDLANQTFRVDDAVISRHHSFGRALLFLIVPCLALKIFSEHAAHGR